MLYVYPSPAIDVVVTCVVEQIPRIQWTISERTHQRIRLIGYHLCYFVQVVALVTVVRVTVVARQHQHAVCACVEVGVLADLADVRMYQCHHLKRWKLILKLKNSLCFRPKITNIANSNSLATAQTQIGPFLSKQLIFAKRCKNLP